MSGAASALAATPLVRALRSPEAAAGFRPAEWELAVRAGRRAALLAALAHRLARGPGLGTVPAGPRRHLEAALRLAGHQARALRHEAMVVRGALAPLGVEPVLLKGAAYVLGGLPPAPGRLVADLDLLLPRACLPEAERLLFRQGWLTAEPHPYDQRYYREWMHEIPPLRHARRGTLLDLHHALVPPTSRLGCDPGDVGARAVRAGEGFRVPAREDLLVHAALHRLGDGEHERALRDLWDLDRMVRAWLGEAGLREALEARAAAFRAERALAYALGAARAVFGTPLPEGLLARLEARGRCRLGARVVVPLLLRAADPARPPAWRGVGAARWLMYVRGHWTRMPLRLLIPHLLRKARRRPARAGAAA